jgi:hypothetical protein
MPSPTASRIMHAKDMMNAFLASSLGLKLKTLEAWRTTAYLRLS